MKILKKVSSWRSMGFVLTLTALTLASCSDDTAPNNPVTTVSKTGSTDRQMVAAGTVVPISPEVVLLRANDEKAEGETVTFAVATGGGSITGAVVQTDSRGVARVGTWTLGPVANPNTLTAVAGGMTVTFTAFGTPGQAASLVLIAGHEQTATVRTEVTIPPEVRVIDAFGNGVQGIDVDWQVTNGSGVIVGSPPFLSEPDGLSSVGWELGVLPGANALQASAAGLTVVNFTATGTP
jgi:hypothetical protein